MLLIFDWDGTLSDSAPKIVRCVQQAAESTGFEVLDDDSVRNIIGLGLPEAIKVLYPDLALSERERIREKYVEHFLASDQEPSPFFDGVIEGLHKLRDQHYQMAVATGKSRRGLERVLDKLAMQHFFDGSRCADETESKPSPLMLNELLHEFKKAPSEALMIGDTEYDMGMAERAHVERVAVSYGAHHIDRLKPYKPLLSVDHFTEFVDWVLSEKYREINVD